MGIGDWGLWKAKWGWGQIPDPQSQIQKRHSPQQIFFHVKAI